MWTKILICFAISIIAACLTPCEPFGLRIYYGDVLLDPLSPSKAEIYFNTKQNCTASYVHLLTKKGFQTIKCSTQNLVTSSKMNSYIAYIHKCIINDVKFDETFTYTAYGWQFGSSNSPTPYREEWVEVKLANPTSKNRELSVVVLADWGAIETNIDVITPITESLKRTIREKDISAIIIDGDIAYDLDSNNGVNYEKFLNLMSEVSLKTPIIHVPGNHQHASSDAEQLFSSSFKLFNVDNKLAAGLNLGSLYLIPFDPYRIVYYKQETVSSLQALKKEVLSGSNSGRFVVPFSHYPLICSGEFQRCNDGLERLRDHFDVMMKNGVSLYVGAHTHTYERNYPYFANRTFSKLESPYQADGNYLISIVEGVAGTDHGFISTMPQVQSYTARYTVNETGFAVIESKAAYVSYSHFSTKQGFMDSIKIYKKVEPDRRGNLQIETE